jgi:hypothetical protein
MEGTRMLLHGRRIVGNSNEWNGPMQRYEGTLLRRSISYVKQGRITHLPNGSHATVFAEEALEVGTLI